VTAGRFIPDDPGRLPLPARAALALGVALAVLVLAFVCMDVLDSWGVWVTLLLVSVLAASGAAAWAWDTFWRAPEAADLDPGDGA